MNQQKERIIYLFNQYKNGACTSLERSELMELILEPELEEYFRELIQQDTEQVDLGLIPISKEQSEEAASLLFDKIIAPPAIPFEKYKSKKTWWQYAAAAAILLFITGTYLFVTKKSNTPETASNKTIVESKTDVAPGGNKAFLTLADGSTIVLDSAANGELVKQGNANVLKTSNGQLTYHTGKEATTEIFYNTLSTPRGGQYQLLLPDGTKVWLNAASTLRYPTAFIGKQRRVEVTGEAYFEVAKNKSMPFKVVVNNRQEVEVLGTHFNISAYDDELILKTTLLEGSVLVSANDKSSRLIPGQQTQVDKAGAFQMVSKVDVGEVIAWKNGYFQFVHADVKTVMRQFARWYDVDVEYQGRVTDELFGGKLERSLTLSQVLKVLERMGLHYQLKEKKLIVTDTEK